MQPLPYLSDKSKRRLRRFWNALKSPPNIIGWAIFILVNLTVPLLELFKRTIYPWTQALIYLFILVVWLLWLIPLRRLISSPRPRFFEPVDFGQPDEQTLREAADGILSCRKAEPFYVHAVPQHPQLHEIFALLDRSVVARVEAGSGSGKSLLAYQAAYALQASKRYRVYQLKTDELEAIIKGGAASWEELLLFQLDDLRGGVRKLVLIDDAHNIRVANALMNLLRSEVSEDNCECIWIETESPAEADEPEHEEYLPTDVVRPRLDALLNGLVTDFYHSTRAPIREIVQSRARDLEDALARVKAGKITDAWDFNFCATCGWETLAEQTDALNDRALLVLFLIAAHVVLNREGELHVNDVASKVQVLSADRKLAWLSGDRATVWEVVGKLSDLRFIKVYAKGRQDRGYVTSRHPKYAREVIRNSLNRIHLVHNLLASVKVLLTEQYQNCLGVGMFHRGIGPYAAQFDEDNKKWLTAFLNDMVPEELHSYSALPGDIRKVAPQAYAEIVAGLDIQHIAGNLSCTPPGKFHELARLLSAFPELREELKKDQYLSTLAQKASTAQADQFHQLAYLLSAFPQLIEKLDLAQLTRAASAAGIEHFLQLTHLLATLQRQKEKLIEKLEREQYHQLAQLLSALEEKKTELSKNPKELARVARDVHSGNLQWLAALLNALGEWKGELIKELDMANLAEGAATAQAKQFHQLASLLNALGEARELLLAHWLQDDGKMLYATS